MNQRTYIAIDLKSFYASAECVSRGLDPLTTHLVVADESRSDKTICLAVSPSLKAYGIPGRPRLFEVKQKVAQINAARKGGPPLEFLTATPRMAHYIDVSSRIYGIYLRFIAPEDIHVYSIDEVFIDATEYLRLYGTTPHDLAMRLIREVLRETGITATAGIGPNLYLAKVAMDIEAKHSEPDRDGVRIAALDEMSYRQKYWMHRPLTDFWRIGRGIASRLEAMHLYTLGDVARRSLSNEESLYREFGVNAELLIDHAWGWEPCTMAHIKAYRPLESSLSSGQVLMKPYPFDQAAVIVREMTDLLVMDLVERKLVTDQMVLHIGYDNAAPKRFSGSMVADWYGRPTPKPAHGSVNLDFPTSSTTLILKAITDLFKRIVNPQLMVRRVYVVAVHIMAEDAVTGRQLSLFDENPVDLERERRQQEAILEIRRKFGKNAILKGMNFEEGATTRERNEQIGGHKA
ncbi:MAG: Y-family DNA polymerase [Bacteroidales bacterium]|nr:Y-family DNA polymerase [Bacteroidales bacterium]